MRPDGALPKTCAQCGMALGDSGAEGHRCAAAAAAPKPAAERGEHTLVHLVKPGEILGGKWRVESRIGQGAMGSVYLGTDLERRQKVAIKILSPDHCRKPKVLARFEREARLMTTLRHPNIVQLQGVGRQGALPFIVMQYLEGETLADYLKGKGGKLGPVEMLAVMRQVCSGLAFIHHHGLVHRDIKPQNVFISSEGHVTILDLGVVRDRSDPGLTKPGAMVGTPYYMSPEQILGTGEIDRRTDVYALGAVIFELLTGTPPFVADSNFEVFYKHRTLPPPDASLLSAFVPKAVAAAITRSLAKVPEERQQNVSELVGDLEAAYCLQGDLTNRGVENPFEGEVNPGPRRKKTRAKKAKTATAAPPVTDPGEPAHAEALREAEEVRSDEVELVASGSHKAAAPDDEVSKTEAPTQAAHPSTQTDLRERRLTDGPESVRTMGDGDPGSTEHEVGELRVVTTVKGLTSGAAVTVDFVPKGTSPVSLSAPVGGHKVRVEKKGYKPVEREALVVANEVTLLRVELEKA